MCGALENTLDRLLAEQQISLAELVSSEIFHEHQQFNNKLDLATILRKPATAFTAEDQGKILGKVVRRESSVPAASSSSGHTRWGKAPGPVLAATAKAAPAVVRQISKGPPARQPMPTRPTPPTQSIDPPAKRQKPAATFNPQGRAAGT